MQDDNRFPIWAREWSQKRLEQYRRYHPIVPKRDIESVCDWLHSLPEERPKMLRKLHKLTWSDALIAQDKWHQNLFTRIQKRKRRFAGDCHDFKTLITLENHWAWGSIETKEGLDFEGDAMGHCLGKGAYDIRVQKKNIIIYSLRDKTGLPHLTVEYSSKDRSIKQASGRGNSLIHPKYYAHFLSLLQVLNPESILLATLIVCVQRNGVWSIIADNDLLKNVSSYRKDDEIIWYGPLNLSRIPVTLLPNKMDIRGRINATQEDIHSLEERHIKAQTLHVQSYLPADIPTKHPDLYDNKEWIIKENAVYNTYDSRNLSKAPDVVYNTFLLTENKAPLLRFTWDNDKNLTQLYAGYVTHEQSHMISDLIQALNPQGVHNVPSYVFVKKVGDSQITPVAHSDFCIEDLDNDSTVFGNIKIIRPRYKLPLRLTLSGTITLKLCPFDAVKDYHFNGDISFIRCHGTQLPYNIDARNLSIQTCIIHTIDKIQAKSMNIQNCSKLKTISNCITDFLYIGRCSHLKHIHRCETNNTSIISCDKIRKVNCVAKETLRIENCSSLRFIEHHVASVSIYLNGLSLTYLGPLQCPDITLEQCRIYYGQDVPDSYDMTNTQLLKHTYKTSWRYWLTKRIVG